LTFVQPPRKIFRQPAFEPFLMFSLLDLKEFSGVTPGVNFSVDMTCPVPRCASARRPAPEIPDKVEGRLSFA